MEMSTENIFFSFSKKMRFLWKLHLLWIRIYIHNVDIFLEQEKRRTKYSFISITFVLLAWMYMGQDVDKIKIINIIFHSLLFSTTSKKNIMKWEKPAMEYKVDMNEILENIEH